MVPPAAQLTNVSLTRFTLIQVPRFTLCPVFVHATPGSAVTEPIDAPNAGPGYPLTPDGVHATVTGLT